MSTKVSPQNPPLSDKSGMSAIQILKIQLGSNQVSEDQGNRISELTKGCIAMAEVILKNSKSGPDQSACLRKLREIKYVLTNSIATEELVKW